MPLVGGFALTGIELLGSEDQLRSAIQMDVVGIGADYCALVRSTQREPFHPNHSVTMRIERGGG